MGKAYWKDIWRTVKKEKKRFISIAVITALGVTMMCGLRAACEDLRCSADRYFDEQKLFDIRILSTLGLTDDDVKALEALEEVEDAEGGYNETVYTKVEGIKKSIQVYQLSSKGFNEPYLLEGEMPEKENEIVITENYINQSGKQIGDYITLDEEPESLKAQKFKITGIIVDTLDINSTEGSMGFRTTSTTDYMGYVSPKSVDSDVYTAVYLSLEGTKEMNCYTDEYEEKVEQVVKKIESKIKQQREQARYDEVYNDAMEEWLDGEQEMKDEFAKADKEIADAKAEIADAKRKLANARKEIADGKKELIEGEKQLEEKEKEAEKQIADARTEIEAGYQEITDAEQGYAKLLEGQKTLDAQVTQLKEQVIANMPQLSAYAKVLEQKEAELDAKKQALDNGTSDAEDYAAAYKELEEAYQALQAEKEAFDKQVESVIQYALPNEWKTIQENKAQIDAGLALYEANLPLLEESKVKLAEGEKELEAQEYAMKKQFSEAWQEIADGWRELTEGEKELSKGEKELADGERELNANIIDYQLEKAKAEKELADAKEEIDDIDMTKWYVQDRTTLSGFTNVKGDADSIQAIGDIFPILFLVVAILISLTTITRMVDEERGLIGTYKALGFTNQEIRRKYILYAFTACLIGGIIGDFCGYVVLPKFLFTVFNVMYLLPEYYVQFDVLYGLGGIIFFEAGILGATFYACERKLKRMPAVLMRPKAPKSGARVLLERVTFVWKRLSFLNKVTARNIFRYKKRMFMTIVGIMGCTALLLCGFTIKNTVSEMVPQQYDHVYKYDLMAVTADDDYDILKEKMSSDSEIDKYLPARIESLEIFNAEGKKETVQLIVVSEGELLEPFICLKDKKETEYILEDGEVFLTRNATRILGLESGDDILVQNMDLAEARVNISQVVENYFGNTIYMTEKTYTEVFGDYNTNAVLATFADNCKNIERYTDELARMDEILSATSTQEMAEEFDSAFQLINMVVYIVLFLAAMLAFVVLFTLSNTNISERERELATIKVLGFYNQEVHSYVNKETLILTLIGIVCGMPAGYGLGRYVMGILELPSLEFYITLYRESYGVAAVITIIFAILVNFITNGTLNKINMIEALKSVE